MWSVGYKCDPALQILLSLQSKQIVLCIYSKTGKPGKFNILKTRIKAVQRNISKGFS